MTITTALHSVPKNAFYESIKFLKIQSADEADTGGSGDVHQVLTFVDDSAGTVDDIEYQKNPIASMNATTNTSLGQFLSRPTRIDSRTWATTDFYGVLGSKIEPWALFLSNPVIKNKIVNYGYLRAKLCLKIIINATPFHFGLMRVAYEPSVNAANTGFRKSTIRDIPASSNVLVVPYSQLPGIWIHPADNSAGELHVPFFLHKNWLSLEFLAEAKSMGTLTYDIAGMLGIASATGSSVLTIDTYAWLEDVELSASTAELILQARDEYDGVISSVASAVAKFSTSYASVPIIGRYARATSIGAGAVSKIAHLFGYTNTPVITDIKAFQPTLGPNLATSEIGSQVTKLTLDPKQELSIDPTLHGLSNDDEMALVHILTRPSTLVITDWRTVDTVGTVMFCAAVSPMLFQQFVVPTLGSSSAYRIYSTPMSYVGAMFTHWRGDIVFDIEVVCTKFHKGRLKISWDPHYSGTVGSLVPDENTVFNTILDIGESNKTSLVIPYHQALAWQRCRTIDRVNYKIDGTGISTDPILDNGGIVVSILTPLMSPVTPQTLDVMISVRGATNLEFANPSSTLGSASTSAPPSIFAVQSDDVDIESTAVSIGDNSMPHPERYALNFGERVVSLRQVLHRMSLYDVSNAFGRAFTFSGTAQKSYTRLPPMFGYDPFGKSTANKIVAVSGTAPFNYVPTHPITYVSLMYGAFRGGVNYVANISSDLTPYIGDVQVCRITNSTKSGSRRTSWQNEANVTNTASSIQRITNIRSTALAGGAFTNTQTNGSISWNQPHMSGVNFNYCDPNYSIEGNSYDQTDLECSLLEVTVKQTTADTVTKTLSYTSYAGSGVDYTCLWWLCCPTLDYYFVVPSAV